MSGAAVYRADIINY